MQDNTSFVRPAVEEDLDAVLSLYTHAHGADDRAHRRAWQAILADPRTHLFILDYGGAPVSTCVLHILPNLTRGAWPYGLVENVVIRPGVPEPGVRYGAPRPRAGPCVAAGLLQGDASFLPSGAKRLPALRDGRVCPGRRGRARRVSAGVTPGHVRGRGPGPKHPCFPGIALVLARGFRPVGHGRGVRPCLAPPQVGEPCSGYPLPRVLELLHPWSRGPGRRHFNPRAYVRHDWSQWTARAPLEFQSTCLREARRSCSCGGLISTYFNPRAYVRHDDPAHFVRDLLGFQSTCLREARQRCASRVSMPANFNPRAYVRHDFHAFCVRTAALFQSTCLREARRSPACRDSSP